MVFWEERQKTNLVRVVGFTVLALLLKEGTCDSICPNGLINITASSGSLIYPSSGNYGVNETKCWKIEVPDTYAAIGFRFYKFDLERCENCKCDHFQSGVTYNNLDVQSKSCGRYSFNYLYEYLWFVDWSGGISSSVSGSTAYIRFVSDDTEHYSGFNLTFIGGSSAGRQVQIDFVSFNLEDSADCQNDYVEFRDAYVVLGDPKSISGEYGPILTNRLCGSTKPSSIQSQGNIVWVQFKSNSNSTTVYKGFKATFKAGQGRLFVSSPLTLLLLSALLVVASKNSVL
ncbi:hypothetical protein pdam_00015933 [Pocillopora damicornis]|uniref:CUB domain-containing protein n=1 Tax=Pocillopora damicornis TaxID=46731 RepID=A0A3M6UWA2_POCDA|nr:hypothetical protein pdam_00015933 [Pocillopora damicornis]